MKSINWLLLNIAKFCKFVILHLSFLKFALNYIRLSLLLLLFSCNGKTQNSKESIIKNSVKPVNSGQVDARVVFSGIFTAVGEKHELGKNFHLSNGIYFECLSENNNKIEEKIFVKLNFKSNSNSILVLETSKLNSIESCFKDKFTKWINQSSLRFQNEGFVIFSKTSKIENLNFSNKIILNKWILHSSKKNYKNPRVYK